MIKARELKDCSESDQNKICNILFQHWQKEFEEYDLSDADKLRQHLTGEIYKCFAFFEESGEFIGTVSSNTDTGNVVSFKTNFFICNLFVVDRERGKGFGKYMLEHIEKFLVSQGVSNVTLYCERDVYDFYIKHKYSDFGTYPGKSHLTCMMKFLS